MINVVATIRVKAGRRSEFLKMAKSVVPKVTEEKGCIQYVPTVDIDAGLPIQSLDENVVTMIEKWESLEALRDHLKAPHMQVYLQQIKDMVEGVSLKVLKEA
jgi:quinol monooxygenase YgiN